MRWQIFMQQRKFYTNHRQHVDKRIFTIVK